MGMRSSRWWDLPAALLLLVAFLIAINIYQRENRPGPGGGRTGHRTGQNIQGTEARGASAEGKRIR